MSLLEIVTTLTTLSVVASAVCATPTPKDDAFMAKYVYPIIEALALNVGKAKNSHVLSSNGRGLGIG